MKRNLKNVQIAKENAKIEAMNLLKLFMNLFSKY